MPAPDPRRANAPTNRGVSGADLGGTLRNNCTSPMLIFQRAIESFNGGRPSKRSGSGYRNNCPFGHRSRDTIAFWEGENGAVRFTPFCLCDKEAVLSQLGLTWGALYPAKLTDYTPEGRRAAQQAGREASILAAMEVIRHEAKLVRIVAGDVVRGDVSETDHARCIQADQRIEQALGAINVRFR